MKTLLLSITLLSSSILRAGPISFTLGPQNGILSGSPGQTVGWNFSLVNGSTDWISVTNAALTFETNSSVGTFTDFIGPQGGPQPSFAVAPGVTWSETFNFSNQLGFGAYAIGPGAVIPSGDSGTARVNFDIFNGDPTTTGIQTGSSFATAEFTVSVTAQQTPTVPEPATVWISGGALLLLALAARRARTGLAG